MSEIGYIIDCSFELLESTPDVYESFDFALFNHQIARKTGSPSL